MSVFYLNNENKNIAVELGNNMDKYNYSIEIEDVDVLKLVNTINDVLDSEKEDVETLLDIKDYNNDVIEGYINIGKLDLEFNEHTIIELVEETLDALDVKYDRHTMPNVDIGEYYFPITILRDNMMLLSIEIEEDIKESTNNIEYNIICKEEEKEEIMMDNAIIDNYDDCGTEETTVLFEDELQREIEGDWYCRASGGGFSSSQDYWNYILG